MRPIVSDAERGFVVWLTGLSGAGKSTLARMLEARLLADRRVVEVLDGDVVRTHLSTGLGYSRADRAVNIQRIAWVASRIARAGGIVIVAAISPYADARDEARKVIEEFVPFLEIHVSASIETCVERDVKGLYERALRGEISDFTGVSAPYEEPAIPELLVDTEALDPEGSIELIVDMLRARRLIPRTGGETKKAQREYSVLPT